MNMKHATPYLNAMHAKDWASLGQHLSEEIVLESPFVTTPFQGKKDVVGVLKVLLQGVDEFETTAIIEADSRAAIMLRIRIDDVEVTGVDAMEVDADGLITRMSVQWRPLEKIVAIQQKLAPLIGAAPLALVEMDRR